MPPLPFELLPIFKHVGGIPSETAISPVQRSQRPELFVKGTGGGTGATGRAFVMVMTFFPQLFQDLGLGCWKEKMKKGLEFLALL